MPNKTPADATVNVYVGAQLTAFGVSTLPNVTKIEFNYEDGVGHIEWYESGGKPRVLDWDLVNTSSVAGVITNKFFHFNFAI
jgi:hypothetical protein